jgi:hypothetical protein
VEKLKRLLSEVFIPDLFQPGFDKSEHGVVGDPEPVVVVVIPLFKMVGVNLLKKVLLA